MSWHGGVTQKHSLSLREMSPGLGGWVLTEVAFAKDQRLNVRAANPAPRGSWHMELNPELKCSACSGLERQTELFSLGIKASPGLALEV